MGRRWSNEELEFLEDKWGVVSIPGIAKELKRPVGGIKVKAKRIGLDQHLYSGGKVTINLIIKNLGYSSYTWMIKQFTKYGCPIQRKKVNNRSFRVVDINEFWKWAKENQEILNFRNFEENSLGLEPKWVKEKRKHDKTDLKKLNKNKLWTIEEEKLLLAKLKSYRYTCKELSQEFNRTEEAILKKISKLGIPYRPIPKREKKINEVVWSSKENKEFIELYNNGYSKKQISKILKKNEDIIEERIDLLNYKEKCNSRNKPWSIAEEKYLFKYKDIKTINELALELDRSKHAIQKKLTRLNVNLIEGFKA
ncbi:hypothetical protein [uncultured Clostridium sp.]|jgi:hypothetical protein|uniref:hypothetical protein n=1 Tax=uncultured Clostridium sp. TaxID=59620 RepID=UPI00205B5E6B|nr:hypothetical protein [uncultured Clostridium sp.]MDU2290794.1 hypothetical protein [Clostridium celatum]DAN99176.1 MAG TPA: DNA-binding protein [Caudoviricetes sp.]